MGCLLTMISESLFNRHNPFRVWDVLMWLEGSCYALIHQKADRPIKTKNDRPGVVTMNDSRRLVYLLTIVGLQVGSNDPEEFAVISRILLIQYLAK